MRETSDREKGLTASLIEHDACGVGFVANIRGEASHSIVETGIEVLKRLEHRGACGCDPETGDGAGVLLQIPDRMLRERVGESGVELPAPGRYGVAMCFLPPAPAAREWAMQALEAACRRSGLRPLAWRDVAVVVVNP